MLCTLLLAIFTINCGGAGSGSLSSAGSDATGGILTQSNGLLPIPEDIFDLPNTLPDAFSVAACPASATKPIEKDLVISLSSPTARVGMYDGKKAYFIQQNASPAATIALDVRTKSNRSYSASERVVNSALSNLNVGKIRDANNVAVTSNNIIFGNPVPEGSLVSQGGAAYQFLITSFIPGHPGDSQHVGFPSNGFEGNVPPGVYLMAVSYELTTAVKCTAASEILVVCPVNGVSDCVQ